MEITNAKGGGVASPLLTDLAAVHPPALSGRNAAEDALVSIEGMLLRGLAPTPESELRTFSVDHSLVPLTPASPVALPLATMTQVSARKIDSLAGSGDGFGAAAVGQPAWVLVLGITLIFAAAWVALLYFISRHGWRNFAARYRAGRQAPQDKFIAKDVRFGGVLLSYWRVVRVAFSSEGLHLAPMLPFRAFHDPLLIPWNCVKSIKRRRDGANVRYRVEVEDSVGRIQLRLPGAIGERLSTFRQAAESVPATAEELVALAA
jgi:hypothetical protein